MLSEIKSNLFAFHQRRGFVIHESFPLITNDPTVLFVNATVTPFKNLFCDATNVSYNYAIIQQCLRLGKELGAPGQSYLDPNRLMLFDMFGSGIFGTSHHEAVGYFLDLLVNIGLSKNKLLFTIPRESLFKEALRENGIEDRALYAIAENAEFWQEWRFGKRGLIGKGITAIYTQDDYFPSSIGQIHNGHDGFVELGNLIYVYGAFQDNGIIPIVNKGFEVGLGMGRLANALYRIAPYDLLPLRELVSWSAEYFKAMGEKCEPAFMRSVVDHLRVITLLIDEGLVPGNKERAFVLRKLIRDLLEIIWVAMGEIVSIGDLLGSFLLIAIPKNKEHVVKIVIEEEESFLKTLNKGRIILQKAAISDKDTMRNTYGIRESLIPLLEKV